jgi:signal transduction histidine kinase
MEAWKPTGSGQLSTELDTFAMADLVLRSRAIPNSELAHPLSESQVEQRVEARTAELREHDRIKDQFLAMLSHELRTPLMPALIALGTLESRADLPSDAQELIALIARNVRLEARLVDDLLDLTRVTRGKLRLNRQPTDAHTVLRHALEVCAAEITSKQQIVHLSLDAPQATILADAGRLQQVFWNLLENAVKFTPAGGTITCRSSIANDRLKIEILDTGIGIDSELLPKIFDAFEQGGDPQPRPLGGLGLGLAIVRGLVEAHGGTVSAESEGKDLGSTFSVELPLAPLKAKHDEPSGAPQTSIPNNAQLRLLLVEDHLDSLHMLERLLRESGYLVTTAQDVKSAIDHLNCESFDLLISDITLPDGTGYELMKHARNAQQLKGIALTGLACENQQQTSAAAGFSAHIKKPIEFKELKKAIEALAAS